jgi:AraC-like DNA-binding protein
MTALDRLRGIVAEHATEGMHATVLPRVSLVAFSQTTELTGDMAEPGMALVVQGVKRTVLGDREFTYGPSNIASVGYAVGYDSPSQFSREYHRMYGVPPGHTQPAPEPRRRPAEQALLSHPTVSGGRTG